MAHRADGVASWVVTTLTGLTTTGTNIFRARAFDLADDKTPALAISMGPDTPIVGDAGGGVTNVGFIHSELQLAIDAKVATNATQIDTLLHTIRAEVDVALRAAYATRPSYVIDFWENGAGAVEVEPAATKVGVLPITWTFKYMRSINDPNA